MHPRRNRSEPARPGHTPASCMNEVSPSLAFRDEASVLPHCRELHQALNPTSDVRMSGRKAVDALRPLPGPAPGSAGRPG